MSDTYFPEGAVFVMLLLIMVVNPLLKLLPNKKIYLDTRQLALIFGMLLMACTVPTKDCCVSSHLRWRIPPRKRMQTSGWRKFIRRWIYRLHCFRTKFLPEKKPPMPRTCSRSCLMERAFPGGHG